MKKSNNVRSRLQAPLFLALVVLFALSGNRCFAIADFQEIKSLEEFRVISSRLGIHCFLLERQENVVWYIVTRDVVELSVRVQWTEDDGPGNFSGNLKEIKGLRSVVSKWFPKAKDIPQQPLRTFSFTLGKRNSANVVLILSDDSQQTKAILNCERLFGFVFDLNPENILFRKDGLQKGLTN